MLALSVPERQLAQLCRGFVQRIVIHYPRRHPVSETMQNTSANKVGLVGNKSSRHQEDSPPANSPPMRLVIILNPSLIWYFPWPNYYFDLSRFPVFKTFRNSIRTMTASFPLSDCNIHMLFGKTIFRFRKQAMPFGRDNFTWMVLNHVRLPPLTHFTRHE